MKLKDIVIAGLALAMVALFSIVWFMPDGVGKAPSLSVTTLDGRVVNLDQLRGKPLLVTFWATSCPGCIQEMPHLVELYKDLHPKGLEIIGIAMPYDPPSQVVEMVKRRQIPYPIALDPDSVATRSFGDIQLTPTSFLIAPDGRIVQQKIGEMDMDRLRGTIQQML